MLTNQKIVLITKYVQGEGQLWRSLVDDCKVIFTPGAFLADSYPTGPLGPSSAE